MLFNSPIFVFYFLPVALAGFYLMPRARLAWIIGVSVVFYGAWEPRGLFVLGASIALNYSMARLLVYDQRWRGAKLAWAVVGNLALLGWFKYAGFVAHVGGWTAPDIILPLGISFFTFTQLAFVLDAYAGKVKTVGLKSYLAFVTFFPHLIAGPIYHHKEMMGQFAALGRPVEPSTITLGMVLFGIGLFKKIALADSLAPYATSVFGAAQAAWPMTFLEAWGGALAFFFQVYFDFSGYTDMALGLAMMFGVTMPQNFCSPYRATSIIELWRRWHMTLTRFLTDYIYTPLALSMARSDAVRGAGRWRRFLLVAAIPVNVTFLASGVWHGAGWTFITFGIVNGVALTINYAWREARLPKPPVVIGWGLACGAYLLSLVFFRSPGMHGALHMLGGMLGHHGLALPDGAARWAYFRPKEAVLIVLALGWALLLPNSQIIIDYLRRYGWRFGAVHGGALAGAACALVVLESWLRESVPQFIYFQF